MRKILIELRGDKPQEKVAKAIGISQQFLSYIESGTRTPSIKTMRKLANYYNMPITELFSDIFLNNSTTNRCGKDKKLA